jgi:hypothetical protein
MLVVDVHAEASCCDPPTRPIALKLEVPAVALPTTVTLIDPVTAMLTTADALAVGPMNDIDAPSVPTCSPSVPATIRPARIPIEDLQRTLLSEIHSEPTL